MKVLKKILLVLVLLCTIALTACSTTIDVTVVFETNGGSEVPTMVVNDATLFTKPADPTREHYDFCGWYVTEDFSGEEFSWVFPDRDIEITLYASWELKKGVLGYDLDGGTVLTELAQEVSYGTLLKDVVTTVVPTKEGYTFGGWMDSSDNVITSDSTVTMPDDSYTLKAKWVVNKYNLTLNLDGGTCSTTSLSVDYGTLLSECLEEVKPTKEGYTFASFALSDETSLDGVTMPASDYEVIALYTKNSYTITFNAGTNGVDGNVTSVDAQFESNVWDSLPAEADRPTREGYYFAGWFTSDDREVTNESELKMPAQGITLTAKWTRITYTVSYDLNGGTFAYPDTLPTVVVYNQNVSSFLTENENTLLCTFAENSFIKWTYADGSEITADDTFRQNMTLKANWLYMSKVTVVNENQETEYKASEDVKLVDFITTLQEEPTKEGYLYKGLSKEVDGEVIAEGDDTVVGVEGIKLYVIFEKDASLWIKITFADVFGFSAEIETMKQKPIALPEYTAKEGLTMDGWYAFASTFTASTATVVDEAALEAGYVTNMTIIANVYTGSMSDYTFHSSNKSVLVGYTGTSKEVVFPSVNTAVTTTYKNLVTKIGNGTTNPYQDEVPGTANVSPFVDNLLLESVTFPLLVVEVFKDSFKGCTNLKTVITTDFVETAYGPNVFSGCTSLTSIDLNKCTAISIGMFSGCTSLKTVDLGTNVYTIYPDAFKGCTSLDPVSIPRTVRSMYTTAFDSPSAYTIELKEGEKLVDGGIYSTDGKTLINWLLYNGGTNTPENEEDLTIINILEGTEVIGVDAFAPAVTVKGGSGTTMRYGFPGACTINLPTSVKTISENAFSYMVNYSNKGAIQYNIVINLNEGLVEILDEAFKASTGVTELNIPSTVKTIGKSVFESCRNIVTLEFASTLAIETIGDKAFDSINSKCKLGNLTMPNLTSIGESAFSYVNITGLTAEKLVTCGEGAFQNSEMITAVFPMLTNIPAKLFNGVDSLTTYGTTENVIDLKGVESVGEQSFYVGTSSATTANPITSVINIESLTTVGKNAFYLDLCTTFGSQEGLIDYSKFTVSQEYSQLYRFEAATTVKLPAETTVLPEDIFYYWTKLVTVGDTKDVIDVKAVTKLGNRAFNNCSSIKQVLLNDTVEFGTYAFANCTSLTTIGETVGTVDLSKYAVLNNNMFQQATSITTVILNDSVTTIPNYAFDNCRSLETVAVSATATKGSFTLPKEITTLGTYAFRSCSLSGDLVLPETITTIGNYAFANNSATVGSNEFTSVVIPESAKYASATSTNLQLGTNLFAYNAKLTTVVYKSSSKIMANTFSNCKALTSVTLTSEKLVELAAASAFTNVASTCSIYVPEALLESYKAATNWKNSAIVNKLTAIVTE